MNRSILCIFLAGSLVFNSAYGGEIKSFCKNGSLSFEGLLVGTTATVEWAASLTDAGRTNWQDFACLNVVTNLMTADIPMFFRVRGTSATNLPNGLMSHYTFDADEGGVVSDYGPIYNTGTVVGATWVSNGVPGGSYSCFGTNDYIEMGPSGIYCTTGQLSVCAWVFVRKEVYVLSNYRGGSASGGLLVFQYDAIKNLDVLFGQADGVQLRYYYSDEEGRVSTQQWHHVAFSYDETRGNGNKIKIYLDGLELSGCIVQGEGNSGPILGTSDKLRIMSHQTDPSVSANGMIDEVMIFNRALTAQEIRQIYDLSRPSTP